MKKQIIISRSSVEARIAIIEEGRLAELQIETSAEPSTAGNVYRGKVLRVLPGMQAAFVDIGLEKAAFMHVSDFWEGPEEDESEDDLDEQDDALVSEDDDSAEQPDADDAGDDADDAGQDEDDGENAQRSGGDEQADTEPGDEAYENDADDGGEADGNGEDGEAKAGGGARRGCGGRRSTVEPPPIDHLLKPGQEILVQVSKEPMGTKGARATAHISLPGRYIVYMPTSSHIGVSRRIEASKERQRLKKIVSENRPAEGGGYIVRTACEGLTKLEIVTDMKYLARLWAGISKKADNSPAPSRLHEDLDLVLRSVRDMVTKDVEEILIDNRADFERISDFVDTALQPELKSRLRLYDELTPVFDHLGIENQSRRARDQRVWLKSGGYLILEQTEALTTIDVNTGRFVGKRTHEETIVRTNLEAATASLDQLRLRNIGGIIVIDFIDMEQAENRKLISSALQEAVKRDKARTNILKISDLGLVEMTRKRTRENLRQILTTPCPTCNGEGRLLSPEAVASEALREAHRKAATTDKPQPMVIKVASEIAGLLRQAIERRPEEGLARRGFTLTVRGEPEFEHEQFEIDFGSAPRKRRRGGRRRRKGGGGAEAATEAPGEAPGATTAAADAPVEPESAADK
ncbi:MAG: Rne/Rng family ribonuclease [Deltaproteobacteria bacterium]